MAKPTDAGPKHVFVVNDTPEILQMFEDLLGEEGYQVTTDRFTVEMAEMLGRVRDSKPDLLILDYLIGHEERGWQFLQMLKMDRAARGIPVVICTAAVRQIAELRPHLGDLGVAVVLKPFDIDHLLAVVANTLAGGEGVPSVGGE